MDLFALRKRWEAERPRYEALARHIKDRLSILTLGAGIPCEITYRAKEVDSLLKKQLRYGFADPWEEIWDKAGIRIIIPYAEATEKVCALIRDNFVLRSDFDSKVDSLEHDRIGYLGVHVFVALQEILADESVAGLICEVQIHTAAQQLWSAASHDMLYKSSLDVPTGVKRNFYRLIALMEFFDKEVTECRKAIMDLPNRDTHKILSQLEKHFFPLAARDYDRGLSLHVIAALQKLYSDEDLERFDTSIGDFVSDNRQKLETIYRRYRDDPRHLMLFQPEALLVFQLSARKPTTLKRAWEKILPSDLLDPLTTIWAV